jgi:hypothetical protein
VDYVIFAVDHELPAWLDFGEEEPTTTSVRPRPRQVVNAIDTTIADAAARGVRLPARSVTLADRSLGGGHPRDGDAEG